MPEILETLMLICFGMSWPMNVYRNYKARSAKGMSLFFILLIISGYVAGIGAKIRSGEATLEELAAYAEEMGAPALPGSGRQEYLEAVVNNILFCS